ncbi:unnamed protein product [Prunus armeniaca]|uniref:Uncharacterized protein n=1 Tax=Prunus armeniaca TaxID=36596 RepID=A0A6J5V5X8_PRUAR|nr:unnamed protein product [Prunus armeniaca]CAB4313972.1 unnamed protein product [Prunus armeniaca]
MGSPTKIPPILITTSAKNVEPLSQRNNKAEDVVDGAAKSINFSFEDHDDAAQIGKMRYDALIMKIKRQKICLRWYQETLGKEKNKMREAEARNGFDLFCEFARCVVPSYNWDKIAIE